MRWRPATDQLAVAAAGVVVLVPMLVACEQSSGGSTAPAPVAAKTDPSQISALPLGDVAGAARNTTARSISNPYEGNAQAVQQGHDLFVRMNCAGCHGYGATGGMGPNLTDTYWRYGGVPVDVYKSIHDGRPQGMPAWNPALPPDDIWKLVAYIESLGGTFAAADYQAALQGDRPGDNMAPEVQAIASRMAAGPASAASGNASPRPLSLDAGGKP
jgi:cytochrome c oxidase cbb3-type subunit 3